MTIIFQLLLTVFVLFSFVLLVGVPVAYASPSYWNQSKPLLLAGSVLWVLLILAIGALNSFVA
ncbi:photosystem II reaction center protein PsbZ [Tumidithrix elongata RA019]|uniref:Photosystem II reaction center protein Z n=1 Tax=Tumidithrix elongata BACA0141 TaxID=2716417 RepID=A0AAW9Q200_9CYAN|nr:photosystem II reaction center protein PsbZ [Tumidithrix elongata RA019]